MRKTFWFLLLNLMTIMAFAQTFKGVVMDNSGQPVPYAALYLNEMKSGFTADEQGHFETKLSQGQYTCEVSSMGFTSQSFTLQMPGHDYEKTIVLTERVYTLPEVNIVKRGEDPAYAVMRRAIARAPYHRTQVKGFTAGTYVKGTGKGTSIPAVLKLSKSVRNATKEYLGKLFVMEEQQQITFTAPDTWKGRVIAYRNSFPEELQIDMGIMSVNFYTPEIFDKVSPLNKKSFSYYRFRLDGCFAEGGHLINKIRVIPKREDARLLEGDLFVVEDLWCVSAAEFSIRESGLKGKVKVTCKEVQPSVFLPVSTSMSVSISMMGFKAEASYLSAVHYTDVKTGLKPEPKDLEKGGEESRGATGSKVPVKKHKYERPLRRVHKDIQTDSLAGKRDSLYWASVRSVPLRPDEVLSYRQKEVKLQKKDSLPAKETRKQNVVGKVLNTLLTGRTFRTAGKKAWLTLPSLINYIPEYNFVDGFWIGLKLRSGVRLSPAATLRLIPSFYYTTAGRNWIGQGELILDYAPRHLGRLSLSGGILSADYNGDCGESRLVNAYSSALFGHNHIKLYEKTFFTVDHAIEPCNGLLFTASFSWQRRRMLDNHIRENWFKKDVQPNIPKNEAFRKMPDNDILKGSLGLEYTPAHYYHMRDGRKVYEASAYPTFSLVYDRAFPVKSGRYLTSYHRMQFSVRQEIEFGLFNRLYWSANAGTFWNAENMQFPDFKHFATTDIVVTGRAFHTGFSLPGNYAFSTDTRWAQGNVSWYTPHLLLKRLPFLANKPFDEALHLRSIVVYGRFPYTEAGYSIGLGDEARVGVFVGFERLKYQSVGVSFSLNLSALAGN